MVAMIANARFSSPKKNEKKTVSPARNIAATNHSTLSFSHLLGTVMETSSLDWTTLAPEDSKAFLLSIPDQSSSFFQSNFSAPNCNPKSWLRLNANQSNSGSERNGSKRARSSFRIKTWSSLTGRLFSDTSPSPTKIARISSRWYSSQSFWKQDLVSTKNERNCK